jgi:hypothetical protein
MEQDQHRDGRVDRLAGIERPADEDEEKGDDARDEDEAAAAGHRPTVTRSLGSRGEVSGDAR